MSIDQFSKPMNIAAPSLSKLFTFTLGKFLTVGMLNTAITMAVIFATKAWLGLSDVAANACGYAIGMLCSFLLNKFWTFSHKGNTLQTALRFVLVCGFAYLVNLLVLKMFLSLGLNPYLCHMLAMPFYTLMFYMGSKAVVFVKYNTSDASPHGSEADLSSGSGRGLDVSSNVGEGFNSQYFLLFLSALIVSAIVFFYRLTDAPLEVWDEARLANNALEMSKNGLSLITTYEWLPDHWNTKPPLLIWLMAICMQVFGINEFSVRLPSVLASIGTVMLVFWFIANHLRRPALAFLAVIIILASPGYVLVHGARSGNYDALLTLFTTAYVLAAFLFLEGNDRSRRMYLMLTTVAIVLSFYTKTIQGLIFLPALFIFALFGKKAGTLLRDPYFYVACVLAVASCVIYYWYRNEIDPGYFAAVQENDLGGRYSNALEGHHGGPLWYLMRVKYFPWLIPSFILAGYMLFKGSTALKRLVAFLTTCSLFYLCVISSAGTKLAWYAMPLVPLYAIICALGAGELIKALGERTPRGSRVSMVMLGVAAAISVIGLNAVLANKSIAKKEARSYDQHSLALRSLHGTGEQIKSLVVLHPGYPVAPGFPFYVAPTLFYANALTIAGIPTTIVKNIADVKDDATLLVCNDRAAIDELTLKTTLTSGKNCALYAPASQSRFISRN